jgi:formamidopyrimidine-DNA glycosylase
VPELPEAETIAAALQGRLAGAVILEVRILDPLLLASPAPGFPERLRGAVVAGVSRCGKQVRFRLAGGPSLLFHLRMTGGFTFAEPSGDRRERLLIRLREAGGEHRTLLFTDVRRFGRLTVLEAEAGGGPPDALAVTRATLAATLALTRRPVKALLMDQTRILGIGNIYADEILHRAGIHPLAPADSLEAGAVARLHLSLRRVLREAVRRGGSSVRDYLDPCGRRGSFQERHRVYRRTGRPCPGCGTAVERVLVAGRSTHFCPSCQRK